MRAERQVNLAVHRIWGVPRVPMVSRPRKAEAPSLGTKARPRA